MAKLNKKIIGNLSGSLGDIIFKEREGSSYAATRPSKMRATNNPLTLLRRKRFRLSIKLGRAIYSDRKSVV